MCSDPHLFHLSLSPPQLISLHPHLLISPYFLPQSFRGGEGGDGGRAAKVWHQLVSIHRCQHGYSFECSHVIMLTYLGITIQPTCFSSLIIKIHEPASLHVNSYRYESYIYVHISIFLHLAIDSCSVLTFSNP